MIERYTNLFFKNLWSDENKYQTWFDVEVAALKALEKSNKIPKNTTKFPSITWDSKRILEIEEECKHDFIAFLTFLEEKIGPSAKFIHLGLTTSDIIDTSLSLNLIKALTHIKYQCDCFVDDLHKLAVQHKKTLMIGRTHGIHAQPITFGLMISGYTEMFKRNSKLLQNSIDIISVGKLSGAVGAHNNFSIEDEKYALNLLNLKPEEFATQVIPRDRHATILSNLAIVAASIEKLAVNIRSLQRSEINELQEPFAKNQKGSSAMPHKRNPIMCENLCGLSKIIRSYVNSSYENISLWNERDISHSSVERISLPDSTTLVSYMFDKISFIINNLVVNKENMLINFNKSKDVIFSENVLLKMVMSGLNRQEAYKIIQRNSMVNPSCFIENLKKDPDVVEYLSYKDIDDCFDLNKIIDYSSERIG